MEKMAHFDFHISAYTPDTIPMHRLGTYMLELAALMGSESAVHFTGLKKGSTILSTRVENESITKVESRLQGIKKNNASPDVVRQFKKLNELLQEDNAYAFLKCGSNAQVIQFPGHEIRVAQRVGPIREAGTLEGEVIRIGGKDRTIHILLSGADEKTYKLTTTSRDIAKQLATHLFSSVRVMGTGTWYRSPEGQWELENFNLQEFEPLEECALIEAVSELRAIEGSEWKQMEDPLAILRELRRN